MFHRIITLILALFLLTGCTPRFSKSRQYQTTYLDLFDTVTTVAGFRENEAVFQKQAQKVYSSLLYYHQLFDIYHNYSGVNNLKTINDQAGIAPVSVDEKIISLLLDCEKFYKNTHGKVNVMMGSVLSVWHQVRSEGMNNPQNAVLPDARFLEEAGRHTDFDSLVIDAEKGTVYITDPQASLDVGAIAKGWAAEKAAAEAPEGLLISVGGNVCVTGPKDESGTPWIIGIQNPNLKSDSYLHTIGLSGGSAATSGDYQRCYTVAGKSYHHIIDPETLFPSAYWSSVTVICSHSGTADALSTALFLMPQAEGQELLHVYGAEALWVSSDGSRFYSPGFQKLIKT